jgi:AcrR family transcriptional regulator
MGRVQHSLRQKRKIETRAEIVRVAFDLFGKLGYENVPVESIAEAAGISRATFFNYFPQKDLILREVASARMERLKRSLAAFTAAHDRPTMSKIVEIVLVITEENARISRHSKKLLLEVVMRYAAQGPLQAARAQAVEAITEVVARIPRRKQPAREVAETLFAVYIGTMLEWLMSERAPQNWLKDTMQTRLQLLLEGVA